MPLNPTLNLKEVFDLAEREAALFEFAEILPEHLLLGILRKGACRAIHLLVNLRVDLHLFEANLLHRLRQMERSTPQPQSETGYEKNIRIAHASTRALFKTLEQTCENMGLSQQGTDHLLYALLKHPEFPATQIMTEHGLNAENLFREMLRFNNASQLSAGLISLMENARKDAGRSGAMAVGLEHLLVALLENRDSRVVRLLTGQGVDINQLHAAIIQSGPRKPGIPTGYTIDAGLLIAECEHLARQLAPVQLDVEHLLLALLRTDSPEARLLREAGISYETLYLQILVSSARFKRLD